MSYIALYRKYRPITFSEIVGQENVTKVLKNQIKSNKISHAYIFSGSRGTGKTSAAKVFSRAINCLNIIDGEPCNECSVCKSILEGNMTDVIEMDAASNNSVENIRQIRQEVVYATIDVKYRVYIIDEVHMLTTSAFNALLKTLEEPPKNVVFILATTEQHKIPVTILSRCLKFDFNRVSDKDIISRLKYVLKEEKIEYEQEALEYIAKLADGALRDALSILDRCLSESKEILKYEKIVEIVGAIDKNLIKELTNNIYEFKSNDAIKIIDGVIQKGKDLRQLVIQITESFLEILTNENLDESKNKKRTIEIIDRLSKLDNDLKQTTKPEIVLKATIVELCNFKNSIQIDNLNSKEEIKNQGLNTNNEYIEILNKKIENLEKSVEELKNKKNIQNNFSTNSNVQNINSQPYKQNSTQKNNDVSNLDIDSLKEFEAVDEFKKEIVQRGKLKAFSALAGAKIYNLENNILIITENKFAYNILRLDETITSIAEVFRDKYNIEKQININLKNSNEQTQSNKIEEVLKKNDVKYTNID